MKRFILSLAVLAAVATSSYAQTRLVAGGQTNVLLDTATLSSVGLDLSSVSSDTIVPGNLGPDSVAFGINSRNDSVATTFFYELGTLAPFGGSIEHKGSVFFNSDTVEVGDFSIGFDSNRVGGDNSGFFVESTVGVNAILFDIENPTDLDAGNSNLLIEADLLVSAEFAAFLGNNGLTGVDVGDALVEGVSVPEPGAALLLAFGCIGLIRRR